ncbi:MAG TPA: FixH family protein [Bradyrhizobium sp.]|nr:FixH family protein [Bradyrhizobium sp.]
MTASDSTTRPLTGRFVFITVVTFFAIVTGVNIVMMRLAITTLPGTEVDSAYSAGLAYQHEITAAEQQNERNWKVDAHIERGKDSAASLTVHVQDAKGSPLSGLVFSGQLERPTDRRDDQTIEMTELGNGSYRGVAQGILPGQWDLVIEADSGRQRMFRSRNRIVLN